MANLYTGLSVSGGNLAVVQNGGEREQGGGPVLDGEGYTTLELLRRILAHMGGSALLLIPAFLTAAISVALQLWTPLVVGRAIDTMVAAGRVDFAALTSELLRLCIIVPVAAVCQWISGLITNKVAYRTILSLRRASYGKLHSLPLSFIDGHGAGDLLTRITSDVDQIGDGLIQGFTQLFTGVVTIIGALVLMCSLSLPVAAIVVALTPLTFVVASQIARRSKASFAAQQRLQGELGAYVEETVSNHALISAFSRGDVCQAEYAQLNDQLHTAGQHAQFVSSLTNPSSRIVNNAIYAAVAVVGCACVITGWPSLLTVGQVQSFLSYANQYMKPFNEISGVVTQLQAAMASARRVLALLDAEEESGDATEAVTLDQPKGELSFEHVAFSYDKPQAASLAEQASSASATKNGDASLAAGPISEWRPLLADIDFHAHPGERIALVGPTGCGKTTLINLLLRFYEPDAGRILVDGHDVRSLTRESLRACFGMVLQETWLFTGTIHDNIAYARPEATDAEVEDAARRAHAHEFIMQLPHGYDTVVGDGGGALSQGQRQLICIARVMLADPPMIVLDEATSSIDTRTELQVQDAFDRMMEGRTSLVVAHRLSTVRDADCILYLQDGRIAERGTHDELLAKGGLYANLYESQWT